MQEDRLDTYNRLSPGRSDAEVAVLMGLSTRNLSRWKANIGKTHGPKCRAVTMPNGRTRMIPERFFKVNQITEDDD